MHRRLRRQEPGARRRPPSDALRGRRVRPHAHSVGIRYLRAHLQPAELKGPPRQQSPTAPRNLRASWQFSPQFSVTVAVNNVTNKKYWANLDCGNYADPRNVSLTLRAPF